MLNPRFEPDNYKGGNLSHLQSYIPLCDAIVSVFGEELCEVVLHDLSDPGHSIIYIRGNLTNRKVGAPVTEVLLQKLKVATHKKEDSSYYLTKEVSNKTFKSSTTFLRNRNDEIIGCLCINYDITNIQLTVDVLNKIVGESMNMQQSVKTYHEDSKSLVNEMIREICEEYEIKEVVTKSQKLFLIKLLDEKGVFSVKKAAVYVSDYFGVSRITIYNYLKEVRRER